MHTRDLSFHVSEPHCKGMGSGRLHQHLYLFTSRSSSCLQGCILRKGALVLVAQITRIRSLRIQDAKVLFVQPELSTVLLVDGLQLKCTAKCFRRTSDLVSHLVFWFLFPALNKHLRVTAHDSGCPVRQYTLDVHSSRALQRTLRKH